MLRFLFVTFADSKAAPSKYGHSGSVTANPSPMGTPQRRAVETQQSQVGRFTCFLSFIFSYCRIFACCDLFQVTQVNSGSQLSYYIWTLGVQRRQAGTVESICLYIKCQGQNVVTTTLFHLSGILFDFS